MNGNSDQIRSKLSTKIVNTMLAIILVLGLSPLSKASASVTSDSSQPSAAQVAQQSADDGSEGAGDSAEVGVDTGADGSNVVTASGAAPATPNNQSAENVTGGGASGAVAADNAATATAPQPTNQPAVQNSNSNNAVAVQAETYNPNAEPRKVTQGLTVGVYKDKDCNESLGDEAVSTDTLLYGKVNIDFSSDEAPSLASPNICYEFPKDQIDVPNQTEATLYDGAGNIAGSWYIENGVAHLKYGESWLRAHQSGIVAHFNFEFTLGLKDQGDDKSETITFPGTTTSTTVNTKDGNVNGDKLGNATSWGHEWQPSFDASDNSYTWTVKVSPSSYATDLVIEDKIGQNLDFVEGSFSLVDANGNPVSGKCDATINGKTASISLGNLPKGDYYVQYRTAVSPDALKALADGKQLSGVDNAASWKWGSKSQNTNEGVKKDAGSVSCKMVSKSASGDADDIVWTVKLNTGSLKADMSNYKFTDTLGKGHSFKEGTQYEVKDVSGKVVASGNVDPGSGELNFTLPDNIGKQELTVTYHTVMDDASSEVSNEAKVTPPANSIYPEGSETAKFKPVDDETYITKELVDASTASVDGYATWKSVINFTKLPANTDPASIVFYDKIERTMWAQMSFDQICVTIDGESGVGLTEGSDYCLSKDGQNSEFEITFKSTDLVKSLLGPNGHNVVVSYRTHSDAANDVYANTSVLHVNGLEKGRASASYTSKKPVIPPVEKKSGNVCWDANYDWKDGSAKGAWIASWSVSVNKTTIGYNATAALDLKGQPIVVTDVMDEGMVYVDGSAQYNLISSDSDNLSKWQQKPEVKIIDGKTIFTIPTDGAKTDAGATNVYAELSYNTAIKPSLIEVGGNKGFSNKAEARSGETTFPEGGASANVDDKVLVKTSQRASDNSHVTYTIKVNEHAQDLASDSDTLTLVDEMSSTCSFANGSLHVMSGGTDITSNVKYTLENATDENGSAITRLTLVVPDSTALTITYDVSPQGAIGDEVAIDNTVSLKGFSKASSRDSKPWKVQRSNAGTEAQSFGISIKKTDETGNNPLKGAKFSLFRVDLDASTAENIVARPVEEDKETNDAGVVEFGSQENPLNANILYYYVETQAPDGYEIVNADRAYVLFSGVSSQDKADYAKVLAKAKALGIEPGQGTSYNVYNKKSETPAPKGSATLSLKKTVNGAVPAEGQNFEFKLSAVTAGAPMPAEPGDVVSTNGPDAEKSFGEISFDAPGTYTYKIEEASPAPKDGNVWSMAAPVYAQVKVDSAVDGKLPTSVKYYSDEDYAQEIPGDKAVFNNTWTAPSSAKATVKVHKTVRAAEGANMDANEQFEFALYKTNNQGAKTDKIGDSIKVKKDGDGSFGELPFDAEGTYNYVISEIGHNDKGWTAPEDVKAQIVVKRSDDGKSFQVQGITYDGKDAEYANFVDVYAASPVEASLSAKKAFEGGMLADGQFSFALKQLVPDSDPVFVQEKSNDADGDVSFDSIKYDKVGTYEYEISEVVPEGAVGNVKDGIAYDPTVHKAKVVVTDDGQGKLVAEVTYDNDKDEAPTFINTYQADGSAVLSVKKLVNGEELKTDRSFSFELTPVDGAPMPEGKDKLEVGTTGSEASSFGSLKFSLADAGKTYKYRIHETTAASDGWTMAGDVFALVTVGSDQGGGKLGDATVEYVKTDGGQKPAEMDNGSVVFDNQYTTSTSAQIKVSKAVEGGTDAVKDEEFTFELHKANNDGSMSNDVVGTATAKDGETVAFDKLTYTTADAGKTFTYWIVETGHDGNGWTKPDAVKATAKVVENDDLSLSTQVSCGDRGTDVAKFTNQYTSSGDLSLSVYKTVNGGTSDKPGEKFSFRLFAANEDGNVQGNAIGSLETEMGKKADFGSLHITKEGTYHYVIKEDGHNDNGWTAAPDVKVEVVARDNGKGALDFQIEYSNADKGAAAFNNKYEATGSVALSVKKLVNGAEPADGQSFSFAVSRDANDPASAKAPLPTETETSTVGSAAASFDGIQYTLADAGKTYKYTITETTPGTVGWTMAAPVTATVKVGEDNGDGTLKPSTVEYSNADADKGAALFNNEYKQASGEFQLGLVKTVNGSVPAQGQSFEFSAVPTEKSDEGAPEFPNVTTGEDGSAVFAVAKLSDEDAGKTYVYRIHEVSELNSDSGVWKPAGDVIAAVSVGPRGEDSKLPVTVAYSANADGSEPYEGAAKFNNVYREIGGSFQLELAKSVEGKALDRSFSFKAEAVGQNAESAPKLGSDTASSDAKTGKASFGAAKLTAANKGQHYTYKISETSKLSAAWAKAADVYAHVAVSEGLNGDGDLTATVTYSADEQSTNPYTGAAKFVNKYTQASGSFQLQIEKTVNGNAPAAGQCFKFKATSTDAGAPELGEVATDEAGRAMFAFSGLDDSFEGEEFTYTISEEFQDGNGWTKATNVKAKVEVGQRGTDNKFHPTVTYQQTGSDKWVPGPAKFNNTYEADGFAVLSVKKLVNGNADDPTGSAFTFQLKQQDGAVLSEVTAKAGETASFQPIGYTLADAGKTYTYTISEVGGNDGAWFAAKDVTATVEVSDNGNGTLKTEVSYSNAADGQQAAALFDNVYAPASATLLVKKLVNGAEPADGQRFEFELSRDASDPASANAPLPEEAAATTVGSAPASFGSMEFTEPGEYRYIIHETSSLGEGWTNAPDVTATVKVVRDEQARTLRVESIDYGQGAFIEGGQQMALFNNKYEQPKQPDEDTPKGETPQQPDNSTPGDQPKLSADSSASSGVKTGDSLALVGGGVALVAIVAAVVAWFASRRKRG